MILPLTVFGLVLPNYTRATPGPVLSTFQMVFLSVMSVGIYGIFLYVQIAGIAAISWLPRRPRMSAVRNLSITPRAQPFTTP